MSDVQNHVEALILKAIESFPKAVFEKDALASHIAKAMTDVDDIGGSMFVMRWAERAPNGEVSETSESVNAYPDWLLAEYRKRGYDV